MDLYLLRHGIAENQRAGASDSARRLTDEGREKLGVILERARQANVRPGAIITSPYVRARQTAELARTALGVEPELIEAPVLTPEKYPDAVWQQVREYETLRSVLLVGHNPLLSELGSWLLEAPGGAVAMKKGALAYYHLSRTGARPAAHLMWLLTAATAGA